MIGTYTIGLYIREGAIRNMHRAPNALKGPHGVTMSLYPRDIVCNLMEYILQSGNIIMIMSSCVIYLPPNF